MIRGPFEIIDRTPAIPGAFVMKRQRAVESRELVALSEDALDRRRRPPVKIRSMLRRDSGVRGLTQLVVQETIAAAFDPVGNSAYSPIISVTVTR